MESLDRRKAWLKEASSLQRRFNVAWWYQELSIPLALLGLVGGSAALVLRRYQLEIGASFWITIGLVLLGLGFTAWLRARRHCLTRESALVRLEADLALNNALTTAEAGRGSWPPFERRDKIARWRWGQLAFPMMGALSFFLLGVMVPIAPAMNETIENQPYTWSRLESEVEELVNEEMIDEEYAGDLKKRLDELREQETGEWFSAASLEATDSLEQAHSREMNRLERDLLQVEQALRKAADPSATEARRQKMKQQFQEAVEGMRNGQMKPNEDLMKKLSKAAKEGMDGMSEEERKQMQDNLRKLAEKLKEQGRQPGDGDEGGGEGEGEPGPPRPGKGEPERGPGAGGDLFGVEVPLIDLEKFEHLEGKDDKEPEPGDLLNLEKIEHDVDRTKVGPAQSGSAKSKGLGGDRVWKDALDPDEQKSLKSFFESSSP